MKRAAQLLSVLPVATVLALACGASEPPAPSKVAAAEPAAVVDEASPAAPQEGAPKLTAVEPVFDFGAIGATDSVDHVFKLRNEGTADLKIERVQKT